MNLNRTLVILFITLLSLFLLACGDESETSTSKESEADNDELKVALSAQPNTFDPLMNTAVVAGYVGGNVFETLMTLDSSGKPVPSLAESVESSEDGKTHTFKLRENVTFHNGEEMTAEDVVASMNRWAEMNKKAADLFGEIKFEEVDEYQVEMQLDNYALDIWDLIAGRSQYAAIMPKEIVESADSVGVTEYIGTGPYEFVEHKTDQYVHLTKYDDYAMIDEPADGRAGKKEAFIEDLYFYFVTDPSTRTAGLQTGEYDIIDNVPFESYERLEDDPNITTHVSLTGDLMMWFNKKNGLLSDVTNRKAINAVMDNEEIMMAAFSVEDLYRLDPGYMNADLENWASEAGAEAYNQADPEKAKQLLEESGYAGEPLTIITSKDYQYYYDAAVVLQEQLKQIDVEVELENYDWATYLEKLEVDDIWDIAISGASYQTTPSQLLVLQSNWAGWTNHPRITELLDAVRVAEDQEEAKAYWEELQEFLWVDYVPGTPVGGFSDIFATSDRIAEFNVYPSPVGPTWWNVQLAD